MKYIILPISTPISVITLSTVVNSVSSLPKSVDETLICAPYNDEDIPVDFPYTILTFDEWALLQVTPEWVRVDPSIPV